MLHFSHVKIVEIFSFTGVLPMLRIKKLCVEFTFTIRIIEIAPSLPHIRTLKCDHCVNSSHFKIRMDSSTIFKVICSQEVNVKTKDNYLRKLLSVLNHCLQFLPQSTISWSYMILHISWCSIYQLSLSHLCYCIEVTIEKSTCL